MFPVSTNGTDLRFAYSPTEAFAKLVAFSDVGRSAYRSFLLTADIIYPVSYTLFFLWSIALLGRQSDMQNDAKLMTAPLLLLVFDMLENTTIILLLTLYPSKPVALALVASVFTTTKWIFAGLTMFQIAVMLVQIALKNRIH